MDHLSSNPTLDSQILYFLCALNCSTEIRFLARMSLTHLGARPRPLHFSKPLGFLYLKATFERLSLLLAPVFFFFIWCILLAVFFSVPRLFLIWPSLNSESSLTERLCFFKTASIANEAALRFALSFLSASILRAARASCRSVSFSILFKLENS